MPVFEANSETKRKRAVAVRFSNGLLSNEDQSHVTFKCYTKETASKTAAAPNHIVTAEVDGMLYVGKNFGPTNVLQAENCDYYFGIHDRRTGKIQVISAALCQLDPVTNDKQIVDEVNTKSFREKRDDLAKDFGSGRNQRAVNKRLNNALDDDMISATAISVLDCQHTKDQVAELSAEPVKSETSAVPPHNIDATTPDDVYKLKDLISSDVLGCMSFKSQVFAGCTKENIAEWREKKEYFSFILDKLETLSPREDARMLQSKYLMYLQYLMKVFLMKSKDLARKFPLPADWPAPVTKHILDTFTREINEPGKRFQRCVPNRLKDLLLSHILVLSLKLSQFYLVLDPLMTDLNLSNKRITTHAATLGCTIKKSKGTKDKDVYSAVLTVPLKFPEVKGKRAKNRIY